MHKLAKGLGKKKKKQKKGKKGEDDDEFDPEELERYRRERAEAQQKLAESEAAEGEQSSSKPAGENDEWKKFAALTSGIDSVLKKTQDDLDRIKSTSFYQRKAPEPEPEPVEDPEEEARKRELAKRYIGFDEHGNPIEAKPEEEKVEDNAKPFAVTEDGLVEVPDDDDEQEYLADEDIFDTDYIEAIQKVEVELAYIPDSPIYEEAGDDPFDTSTADKVLKTVDKTGKKLVSLGNAVEVLAGRIDNVSTTKSGRQRPRKCADECLLAIDDDIPVIVTSATESEPIEVEKTLLDDDSDLPDIPIDLTKLPPIFSRPHTPVNPEGDGSVTIDNKPLDVSEFELFPDKTLLDEVPVLDDEEFELEEPEESLVLKEEEDPFAEKEPENLELQEEFIEASFEAATFVNEDDPFDTTIAENLLPGKTELKFIEKELDEIPAAQHPAPLSKPPGSRRDYETKLLQGQTQSILAVPKKDLLGGSNTDLSQLADKPIKPVEEISYVDPFDTSSIKELPPGRTELKVLEKELLGETKHTLESLEDDDFDPRADEAPVPEKKKPPRPPIPVSPVPPTQIEETEDAEARVQAVNRGRKPSRPEALDITPKVVAFEIPTPSKKTDLLATGDEEKTLPAKPLTPYYPQKSLDDALPPPNELDEAEVDPFDTSYVPSTAPGKTELKIIESELLEKSTHSGQGISGQNPGAVQPVKSAEVIETLINKRKALEKRQDSILDTAVDVSAEALAPTVQPNVIEEEVEVAYEDPFDTSHATNILPGKTELKLLEKELDQLPDPEPPKPHPVIEELAKKLIPQEDPDFDPRAGEEKKDILCLDAPEAPSDKVLTPLQDTDLPEEDIDPFDTSFASIGPGKTELKLLESELMDQ
ncbi:hypothetical protein QAD02_019646 [Eretmocerus hayati]|uniref:Uncharacterized protein n=1 Tax=Eretmocerus hayati TaxID=131215 RepID=A0ACC2PMP4_9HYME|nr:hypothetical protein QAD02_019646 [Eretmocerus hayati]